MQEGHISIVKHLTRKRASEFKFRKWRSNDEIQTIISPDKDMILKIDHQKLDINALQFTISKDDLDLVRVLLANGAVPDRRDYFGSNPLHIATAGGKLAATKMLLEAGAQVNGLCDGRTAYWCATIHGHSDVQKLLVDYGSTVCPDTGPEEIQEMKNGNIADWDSLYSRSDQLKIALD